MTTKVSDYVVNFIADKGVRDVFFISGGWVRHFAQSLANHPQINYVCNHNEQALSMSVEAYARMRGFGVGIVTSGPAVTNAITGAAGAYLDSTPCMFISGQVHTHTIKPPRLRQLGIQEVDAVGLVEKVTKYAKLVRNPNDVPYELEKAHHIAKSGRPGPVWLDIPLDVQSANIEESHTLKFSPEPQRQFGDLEEKIPIVVNLLNNAKRPVIYAGQGIRLSGGEREFERFLEHFHAPVVTSWNGSDLMYEDHPLYAGRPGSFGQRASNLTLQNSDLLLAIGARMSISQVGSNYPSFARAATKVFVDIDPEEHVKNAVRPDIPVTSDALTFLQRLNESIEGKDKHYDEWLSRVNKYKKDYPNTLPEWRSREDFVNSYEFIERLSDALSERDVITTDMGTSFTGTYQSIKLKKGQRIITSSGLAAMGWGLPGAIGACFGHDGRRTICITGDGGLQFNVQELQTVRHHNLPVKIFVLDNQGYLTMKATYNRDFGGRHVGAEKNSGVSLPDFVKVAAAYGIPGEHIHNHSELARRLPSILDTPGPYLTNIVMDPEQSLEPRVLGIEINGRKHDASLEDMTPHLSPEEMKRQMVIPLYDYGAKKSRESIL